MTSLIQWFYLSMLRILCIDSIVEKCTAMRSRELSVSSLRSIEFTLGRQGEKKLQRAHAQVPSCRVHVFLRFWGRFSLPTTKFSTAECHRPELLRRMSPSKQEQKIVRVKRNFYAKKLNKKIQNSIFSRKFPLKTHKHQKFSSREFFYTEFLMKFKWVF